MRSFDLYSEKSLRDTGVDSNVSRAFAREASDLERRGYAAGRIDEILGKVPTLTNKDKAGLACAGLIVGSPFFLLSIGGTFAMCDQADRMRQSRELARWQEAEMTEVARRLPPAEAKDSARLPEAFLANDLKQFGIGEAQAIKGRPQARSTERESVRQVFFSDAGKNRSFLSRGKNWLQAEKILKLKKILQDQIELLARKQNYHAVCKLSAQVELLDKALKRLG